MKVKKNDVLEALSCLLLIVMVAISFTYDYSSLLKTLMVVFSISIFSIITYLSTDIKEKELGLIKCECMLFCLFLMIYLYYRINMMIPLLILLALLFFTTSRELKNLNHRNIKKVDGVKE